LRSSLFGPDSFEGTKYSSNVGDMLRSCPT
jgi:hypothetical protein